MITRASWNWRRKVKQDYYLLLCCSLCWFVLFKVTTGIGGRDPELTHTEFLKGSEDQGLYVNSDTMQGSGALVKYLRMKCWIV